MSYIAGLLGQDCLNLKAEISIFVATLVNETPLLIELFEKADIWFSILEFHVSEIHGERGSSTRDTRPYIMAHTPLSAISAPVAICVFADRSSVRF